MTHSPTDKSADKLVYSSSRRRFLQVAGALGLGQLIGSVAQVEPSLPQAPQYSAPTRPQGLNQTSNAYTFFTTPEAQFVEAAVARLIPADDLGPGALEAGVSYFIDQQLQGKFGLAAKWYMQGPWAEGTEQQGYQLRYTPQELYQLCIPAIDMHSENKHGEVFSALSPAQQDDILKALEAGQLKVDPLPVYFLATFWQILYDNTVQGFFADPAYGGNNNKAGWRLVGFPGVAAAYRGVLEAYYNKPYLVEPVSLADIQNGTAEADETGHAVHRELGTGRILSAAHHHDGGEREH